MREASLILAVGILTSGCAFGKWLVRPVVVPVSVITPITLSKSDLIFAIAENPAATENSDQGLLLSNGSSLDAARMELRKYNLEALTESQAHYLAFVSQRPGGPLGASILCRVSIVSLDRKQTIASAEDLVFCGNVIRAILEKLGARQG